MKLEPLSNYVVLEPKDPDTTTLGGILIPATASQKTQRGFVVAVGPGSVENGIRVEMSLKVGDEVIFNKFSGVEVEVGTNKKQFIMRETDVYSKIGL